eukprot:613439-Ditylum_brightwellii.AAC.1
MGKPTGYPIFNSYWNQRSYGKTNRLSNLQIPQELETLQENQQKIQSWTPINIRTIILIKSEYTRNSSLIP